MLRRTLLLSLLLFTAVTCSNRPGLRQKAAVIDVSPNPILFQPLAVGKTALVSIQVKNLGNLDLHLAKDPYAVEADNDGFTEYETPITLARDCTGGDRKVDTRLTIVPGDCAVLVLRYAPKNDSDKDDAQLVFESDDPEHPSLSVPIQQGQPPHLQVCSIKENGADDVCDTPATQPPQVEFGVVPMGQNKLNKVRLRNVGNVPLGGLFVYDPGGAMAGDFARSANAPISLDVAQAVDVSVRFTPGGSGPRVAFMQVDSADPSRPSVQVPLRGVTAGPALCADPNPVDFGQGTVGTAVDKDLTLTSCGNVAVQLQQTAFDVLSSPAFTSANLPGTQTVQPGSKITVTIRYSPQDGSQQQGALLIPNDGQPGQYVPLKGSAVYPPACRLESSTGQVSFGQVVRGQSAQRDISVANKGLADCSLTAVRITLGGTFFSVVAPPANPITVRPGEAFASTVMYAPPLGDVNASDTGTVEFDSSDPARPQLSVQLDGSPVATPACKVRVAPSPSLGGRILQFGNVTVGRTKTLPVAITNVGSANCPISGLKMVTGLGGIGGTICLGGTSCGDYKVVAPNAANPLPPGQTTQINISFSPRNTNQLPFGPEIYLFFHTGDTSLSSECSQGIPNDATQGCIEVGLSGQGDISNLAVLPPDLDFGLVTLGCRAKQATISLYNTGTAGSIAIKSLTVDPALPAVFYLTAPPTPFNIPPQGKVNIQATYKPSQAGKESAQLKIETDASNTTSNNPFVTVGLSGTGTTDKHQRDTFNQAARPTVDLLVVMDNSGSMQDYQSDLSAQAPAFIAEALKANADFHIGVTSTENDRTDSPDKNASYSDKLYVGGLWGRPPLIDSTDASASSDFSRNVKVGTCCSDNRESGLESAWHVLTPNADQTAPPQGSQGFLREDARLVMLAVSDEQDQSRGSTGFYSDFFRQVKGQYNAGLVSFNAIIGDPGSGCSNNTVTADDGSRYGDVVKATGGKWYSICSADWAQVAKDMSLDAFRGRVQFALTRTADPATVVVQMNGAAQTAGADYTFDQPTNSVIFKAAPPPAASIVVEYDALCF